MNRGSLRIYLGASPGVGKTYAMLGEGHRRSTRGADVVIGVVETHGRVQTAEQIADLEVMPSRMVEYRGAQLAELDIDALLVRHPAIALIDEYAHTNVPGSRNEKRWQDVEELLDAGIDVITTVNVQHLESLNDVIASITGITQRETVPDHVARRAEQIELVDMSPEALRRRMAHGNIYPASRIDAALSNFFRPGNLGAMRELALLWLADRVEESLDGYLARNGITKTWETRERVVVGITGRAGGDAIIRRAARMAGRAGGDLVGVHVLTDDGLTQTDRTALEQQQRLVLEMGGITREVVGQSTAETLVAFARTEKATQLVLGATRRTRWHEFWHGSFITRVVRLAGTIDVHVIASDQETDEIVTGRAARISPPITRRRTIVAVLLTAIGLPLLVGGMYILRNQAALPTDLLVALAFVLLIAGIGGRLVGLVASITASLLINWYLVEPRYTLTISEPENATALVVFILTAVAVGSVVDVASQRAREARRARVEAEVLARAAASISGEPDPLAAIADLIRATFAMSAVRIGRDSPEGWQTVFESGRVEPGQVEMLSLPIEVAQVADGDAPTRLSLFGGSLTVDDQRVLRVLADQIAIAFNNQVLARDAASAESLASIDEVRTALLRAVSHDLRTPLASIKAMVSGLLDQSVPWTNDQRQEALTTVDQETDRLNRLVGNLLDATRLQTGSLAIQLNDSPLVETVAAALDSIAAQPDDVAVVLADDLPLMRSDRALLERSLANVISNAIRHSGDSGPVRITAARVGDRLHVCVADHGIGVPLSDRERVMLPFQRLGDQHTTDGVGLGLSIARGFVAAMGGELTLDDTVGGGLTVTISVPVAETKPNQQTNELPDGGPR